MADRITVTVHGADELGRKLRRLDRELAGKATLLALAAAGEVVRGTAATKAPGGPGGELGRSIRVEPR
ncbi:MAG TPA: hypothetical protein VM840_13635 [Actinomycetota bacterium]|nr:hypothetical protein [Actinomycetota bacterium]